MSVYDEERKRERERERGRGSEGKFPNASAEPPTQTLNETIHKAVVQKAAKVAGTNPTIVDCL